MKSFLTKNVLAICSTVILLTVLVMWSVYMPSPHLKGVLLQTIHFMIEYVGSLCWFASCFFIPQAVFVICVSLILWAAILFYRRGQIGMARFATVCMINGISAVLMLGYVLLFVGAVG
jgi:hypothetical protein